MSEKATSLIKIMVVINWGVMNPFKQSESGHREAAAKNILVAMDIASSVMFVVIVDSRSMITLLDVSRFWNTSS